VKKIRDDKAIKLFGKRVRELRKKQKPKMSQSQLAYEAGIPRMQVSRIERGDPGLSTIFALANALDVEPKILFEF
jgi:transcriptional regulator with XRE-family HTH domain